MQATLHSYKVKVHGQTRYRVYLGRFDGKDSYKSFRTRIDADSWSQGERERRRTQGMQAATVGADYVLRWEAINKELLELGSSLAKQGEMAIESLRRITKTGTLGELKLAFFADTKSELQPRSEASLHSRIKVFCKYMGGENKDAKNATPEAVLAFLRSRKTSQRDRTNYRLVLSRWLGWAADNGWLPANPIPVARKSAVRKKRNRGEAVTLSPGQTRDLLRAVIESGDLQVGAFVVLSLFGAMRPEEFRGRARINGTVVTTTTNWEDLAERIVTIRPECAKTRMGRGSEFHATLGAWLEWIRANAPAGSLCGPIVSGSWTLRWKMWRKLHSKGLLENLRGRGKGIAPGTGVDRRDILRHSYGSYRLADTKNAETTAFEMGNSVATVLQYYYNWKSHGKEATEYWALTPAAVLAGKAIKIPEQFVGYPIKTRQQKPRTAMK